MHMENLAWLAINKNMKIVALWYKYINVIIQRELGGGSGLGNFPPRNLIS